MVEIPGQHTGSRKLALIIIYGIKYDAGVGIDALRYRLAQYADQKWVKVFTVITSRESKMHKHAYGICMLTESDSRSKRESYQDLIGDV